VSVVCAALAIASGIYLYNVSSYWGVIVADLSIMMLVLLFRAMKDELVLPSILLGLAFLILLTVAHCLH
jgi:hypothetical protein